MKPSAPRRVRRRGRSAVSGVARRGPPRRPSTESPCWFGCADRDALGWLSWWQFRQPKERAPAGRYSLPMRRSQGRPLTARHAVVHDAIDAPEPGRLDQAAIAYLVLQVFRLVLQVLDDAAVHVGGTGAR